MKILHISDLHFGMNIPHLIKHFINEDIPSIQPDLILISGDVTQRARTSEFTELTLFLKQLKVRYLIVPGNHDIPLYNPLARFISPFKKYKTFISPDLTAHFKNETVRVLGVNSVNPYRLIEGKLTHKTLQQITQFFLPGFAGLNILFFHHNFDFLEGLHKPLGNDQLFLRYLKDSPIDIVCTGHSHYANVSVIEKNNAKACLVLHSGTLFCTRKKDGLNSYYFLEISAHDCKVHWKVFDRNSYKNLTTFDLNFHLNPQDLKKIVTSNLATRQNDNKPRPL